MLTAKLNQIAKVNSSYMVATQLVKEYQSKIRLIEGKIAQLNAEIQFSKGLSKSRLAGKVIKLFYWENKLTEAQVELSAMSRTATRLRHEMGGLQLELLSEIRQIEVKKDANPQSISKKSFKLSSSELTWSDLTSDNRDGLFIHLPTQSLWVKKYGCYYLATEIKEGGTNSHYQKAYDVLSGYTQARYGFDAISPDLPEIHAAGRALWFANQCRKAIWYLMRNKERAIALLGNTIYCLILRNWHRTDSQFWIDYGKPLLYEKSGELVAC